MKITRTKLKRIIKEELLREGITMEGFMMTVMDNIKEEISSWQPEAVVQLKSDLETQGFDLTQQILGVISQLRGEQ